MLSVVTILADSLAAVGSSSQTWRCPWPGAVYGLVV